MKNFCYQGNEHDCGFAALKMLFASISKNRNYLYLPKTSQSEKFTFLDLAEIAATHQVNLAGYEIEFHKIHEQSFPMMVELVGNHMVLLMKIKKDQFYFNDPARGKVVMKGEEFAKIYAGKCLVIEHEELDRHYKIEKPHLLPKSFGWIHLVVAAVVIAMLGLDFYLMNLSENVPFIFVLIVSLIFVELFENWYLLKMSNYFDTKYIPLYFRNFRSQNNQEYQKYLTMKSTIFSNSKSTIVFASLAIILGVLISINDARNLLVIAVISLYQAVEKYITQFKDETLLQELSERESSVFDHKETTVSSLIYLNKKANHYALQLTTRNCFFQLVLMFLTLFMMVVSETMSTNFAVFHFGVYFIIGQGISLGFSGIISQRDHQKRLAQFFDKCGL